MARNVEIKARIASVAALLARVLAAGGSTPERIEQDDTFFACAQGRLKLRDFGDGRGELIHYQRADAGGPKLSDYVRAPTSDPAALREALTRAQGVIGRVRKTRLVSRIGATRVHLDEVEGLGEFLELEVVLRDDQSEVDGTAIAHDLMTRLGIEPSALVAGAYLDSQRPAR
jgi:adenylate cyclase class IV